jgi:sulfur carrier protein
MTINHAGTALFIIVNGKEREVERGSTIADLLGSIGWKPEWVVVERNGEPVERARYGSIRLDAGDRLEIVRAVAGGARTNRKTGVIVMSDEMRPGGWDRS